MYTEMRRRLVEYARALEMEHQLKNSKNVGSLNVLTPIKKRDTKVGKGKDMTKDKGGKGKSQLCYLCAGHVAAQCAFENGWYSSSKSC